MNTVIYVYMLTIPEITLNESYDCMIEFIKTYPKYRDGINHMTEYLNSMEENTPFFNLELISIICYLFHYNEVLYTNVEYLTVRNERDRVQLLLKIKDKELFIIGYVSLIKLLYLHFGYSRQSFV